MSSPNGKTPIADPGFIELNQGYLQYANAELADVEAKGGRQRIVLDDARFIGNVVWRQNEQTFDAARGSTSLGVEELKLDYAYLWRIQRIFANRGGALTSDWKSNSHLVNLRYDGLGFLKISGFAYLLDFGNDAPTLSANSYGFRVFGFIPLGDDWKVGYQGSYARQTDAGDNPTSYGANYVWASGKVGYGPIGTLGAGYELLGSDDGKARFVTPLATLHKFNGFADVFLDNGGPDGLQDFFATFAPRLPWNIEGKLIYHRFWSDQGGKVLGDEFDFVFERALNEYVTVLTQGAWFWGARGGRVDRYRLVFQATLEF